MVYIKSSQRIHSLPEIQSQWPKVRSQNSFGLELCLLYQFSGWTCIQKDACRECWSGKKGDGRNTLLCEIWLQGGLQWIFGCFPPVSVWCASGMSQEEGSAPPLTWSLIKLPFGSPVSHSITIVYTKTNQGSPLSRKWQTVLSKKTEVLESLQPPSQT